MVRPSICPFVSIKNWNSKVTDRRTHPLMKMMDISSKFGTKRQMRSPSLSPPLSRHRPSPPQLLPLAPLTFP